MRLLRAAYNSLVWALIITALCFSVEWLQMRVNTGYIFFGITIVATVVLYLLAKRFTVLDNALLCLANLSICLVLAVFFLGPRRMPVVFAAFIREGLHQAHLPFLAVNIVLAVLLIGGIAIILANSRLKPETLKAGSFLAFIALSLVAGSAAWQTAQADGVDALSWLTATVNSNLPVALLLYTVITIVGCAFLALPGAAFAILAGIAFGPVLGSAACLFATTLGAMLGFCLGRFFFKDAITPMLRRSPRLQKLLFADNGGDIVCLMVTRLVPLFPYNLQNYAYGATGISFWRYSLFSLLFMVPGVLAFCLAACGVFTEDGRWFFIGGGALVLAAATGLGFLIKQRRFGGLQAVGGTGSGAGGGSVGSPVGEPVSSPIDSTRQVAAQRQLGFRASQTAAISQADATARATAAVQATATAQVAAASQTSAASQADAILIFSRIPAPGKTMTRMMPALSPLECVGLHKALFADTVNAALETGADVHVYHTPAMSAEPLSELTDCLDAAIMPQVSFRAQKGDSLGERLRSAAAEVADSGYERVLLIGIDAPQLDAAAISAAFAALLRHDAVIYPTHDGGFCLLGAGQRPQGADIVAGVGVGAGVGAVEGESAAEAAAPPTVGETLQKLLSLDAYGTASVFADTLSLAHDSGVDAYLGTSHIDLDTVDDLHDFYCLAQHQDQGQADGWAPKTWEYLRSLPALATADDASPDTRQAASVTPPEGASPSIAQPNAQPRRRTPSTLIEPGKVTSASNTTKPEAPRSLGWQLMRSSQLWEKNPYRFANYRRAQARSVLFPGCNFMAMYPRTLRHLEQLLDARGVGVLYECCYQPVAALGLADDAQSNHAALGRRLDELGVRELVSVCPTCHYFLSSRLGISVVSVYEKLRQLGEGAALDLPDLPLFIPCPDRRKRQLIESMAPFLPSSAYEAFGDVPCCGLGGFMAWRRPQQAERVFQALRDRVAEAGRGGCGTVGDVGCGVGGGRSDWRFYTYCASCVSQFKRLGVGQAEHLLPLILGVSETPQRGALALANRALGKLR